MSTLPPSAEPQGKYAYLDALVNISAKGRPPIPRSNSKYDKDFIREVPEYGKWYKRNSIKNTLRNITALASGVVVGAIVWRRSYQPIAGAVGLVTGTLAGGLSSEVLYSMPLGLYKVNMKEVQRARDWYHYLRYKDEAPATPGISGQPLYTKEALEAILTAYRQDCAARGEQPQGLYSAIYNRQ